MTPDWDVVVCGGGAAGLVLAAELSGPAGAAPRLLVIDDDAHPVERRTWAFWANRPTSADAAVVARWRRRRVHAAGMEAVLAIAPYEHRLVEGRALRSVVEHPGAGTHGRPDRLTGTVEAVADRGSHAVVVVDGRPVTARWVFDSRPPAPARAGEVVMRFVGRRVTAPEDALDPTTATFLDFRVGSGPAAAGGAGPVRFAYVLPLTRRDALVDVVTFAAQGEATSAHPGEDRPGDDAALRCYLRRLAGSGTVTTDHEAGVVPLRPEAPRPATGRIVAIGRRGGLLRPSTGFAVDRILRDARRIARSMGDHGHPHAGRAGPRARHRLLDRVLLDVVAHDPARVEDAFAALFARNPPQRVLRFLDEDTTVAEELTLVATLPPWPFLRAARRLALGRQYG